jgi:Cu-processing system ATP-binding protein
MIKIENLSKKYGQQQVLRSVSLEFRTGQCIAMIGPNGSGKTTLIKAILGLVLPDEGTVTVNGLNIQKGYQYRSDIGYMPQLSRFPEHLRIADLFTMMKQLRADVTAYDEELYKEFGIEQIRLKSLGSLSGGMRQQVSAALAFLFNPSIIILDEPTAALDPSSNEYLKGKVNRSVGAGKLVLVTSHILSDLDDIATQVVYLMEGQVKFFESMETLREQTSETQLNKIIVRLLNQEQTHAESKSVYY